MNKKQFKRDLPGMARHEAFLCGFKDSTMATLVARRLHNMFNEKNMKDLYGYQKVSFITSSSGDVTQVFIGCNKAIHPTLEAVATSMAFRFEKDLEPFFVKGK